jgi:hypothetical protein
VIRQPSYLPNNTTADVFSFREVKSELAELSLPQGGLMMNLKGVVRTISKNKSAANFQQ